MHAIKRTIRAGLDIVGYSIVRTTIALMEHLPTPLSMTIARGCIGLLRLLMPRSRRVGLRNLELIFPDRSEAEREEILTKSYETLARHLVAFAKAPALTVERAREMFDYTELAPIWAVARETAPAGVGCIIVTAHFGSFELLVQAHALLDRPLVMLTRPFGSPLLERFWNQRRELFGNTVMTRAGAYREIISTLQTGKDVLLVMDQNVRVHHAVFVDFFGIPAATTKTVGIAAIRTGAPVFFAACAEVEPNRYRMLYAPIGTANDFPGSAADKVLAINEAIHREFERVISQYPEQWMWIHRRFKTRPIGEVEDLYGGKSVTAWAVPLVASVAQVGSFFSF